MARQEHLSGTIDAGSEAFRFDALQVDATSSVDGDVHFGCLQDIGCDGTDAVDFQGEWRFQADVAQTDTFATIEHKFADERGVDINDHDGPFGHAVAAVGGDDDHVFQGFHTDMGQNVTMGTEDDVGGGGRSRLMEGNVGKTVDLHHGEIIGLHHLPDHAEGVGRRFGDFLDHLLDISMIAGGECSGTKGQHA